MRGRGKEMYNISLWDGVRKTRNGYHWVLAFH